MPEGGEQKKEEEEAMLRVLIIEMKEGLSKLKTGGRAKAKIRIEMETKIEIGTKLMRRDRKEDESKKRMKQQARDPEEVIMA
jgi:hypothetical protein